MPALSTSLILKPVPAPLFQQPVHVTSPSGSRELFVIEQAGVIRRWIPGQRQAQVFLDLRAQVAAGGEMGLLSLAFAPDYARSGRFFVNYTMTHPLRTRISQWRANPRQQRVIAGSEQVVLEIRQPYRNHNGGQLAFGPDDMLYVGTGDGGSANDPHGHGQNLQSLLGKILRLDVRQTPYRIPADNPFVGQAGRRPEIWAYGLRNPWRFSFDRRTGELYAADVGQNRYEEINLIRKGGNYGWKIREGFACFEPPQACPQQGLQPPLVSYDHTQGVSVTGGFVYRGTAAPDLQGIYLYGDFGSGRIWGLRQQQGKLRWQGLLLESGRQISSWGEDGRGELFLLDYAQGQIYQIQTRS
jgi:glucose/arabinose dehydrogenase